MEKYGYKKNENKNCFFEDESKCTKDEVLEILNEAPEYRDFFVEYMETFNENCFVRYSKEKKWEDEYYYENEIAGIQIIKTKPEKIEKLNSNEKILKEGDFLMEGDFEIVKIALTYKYDNAQKKHVYNMKIEYERRFHIKWDVYNKRFEFEKSSFFSMIYMNNYYDAVILHKYGKRQFWSSLKFNDLPNFISSEVSPLVKIWWMTVEKLAEKNWFFKDILNDFEKYSGKYMIRYETLWKIPFSFEKAIKLNSSKEFLARYGKVTKSLRKLPIPLAFNLMKCGIKYEPIIKHCVENIWLCLYFLYKSFSQTKFLKEKERKETVFIPLFKSMHVASWTWDYDSSQDGEAEFRNIYNGYHYVEGYELVPDIFDMLKTLEEPVDFKKMADEDRAWKYHDELVKKINMKEAEEIPDRKLKIHKNYKRLIEALGDKYELIDNEKRLYLEGLMQGNCVYSYLRYIENGECVVFSYVDNDNKRFTIEFYMTDGIYYINQLSGKYNSTEGTEKISDKLRAILKELNKG